MSSKVSNLFHFLSCANVAKNNIDPLDHFEEVRDTGLILPKSRRDSSVGSWNLKADPNGDWDAVFLTPSRTLHKLAAAHTKEHFPYMWQDGEYGFVFNLDDFRCHPDAFFRKNDLLNDHSILTEPFIGQQVTEHNEILFFNYLSLEMAHSIIYAGRVHSDAHLRCKSDQIMELR